MLQGSQSTGKYTTPERSYILKCTSYLAPLAYMPSPIHAVLVIVSGWQITSLTSQHHVHRPPSLPLPTTILQDTGVVVLGKQLTLFAENQRSENRPTQGVGEGGKPSRETGIDCLAVSPRSERSGKRLTLEEG